MYDGPYWCDPYIGILSGRQRAVPGRLPGCHGQTHSFWGIRGFYPDTGITGGIGVVVLIHVRTRSTGNVLYHNVL